MIERHDIRHRDTSFRATADGKDDASLVRRDDRSKKSALHAVESPSAGQLGAKVLGRE